MRSNQSLMQRSLLLILEICSLTTLGVRKSWWMRG
uniref:Uncharacterized protein n=1 Tax=Rhizophora mucronata TaxID=61149 RepID=A0A2P2NNR5_RHIMU